MEELIELMINGLFRKITGLTSDEWIEKRIDRAAVRKLRKEMWNHPEMPAPQTEMPGNAEEAYRFLTGPGMDVVLRFLYFRRRAEITNRLCLFILLFLPFVLGTWLKTSGYERIRCMEGLAIIAGIILSVLVIFTDRRRKTGRALKKSIEEAETGKIPEAVGIYIDLYNRIMSGLW